MKTTSFTLRPVAEIHEVMRLREGAGFPVQRSFPVRSLAMLDPFLLLDHMGPIAWGPGEALGAPTHPHRGFETVTYMLKGRMRHQDSAGNSGELGPGDVQWMTAGGGVLHSEMPPPEFKAAGGLMEGFQLWVNLPARDKRMAPRYQGIPARDIPMGNSEDGLASARVIAGEAFGRSAVIETRLPISFLHFTLQPGARVDQPVAERHAAFAVVVSGAGSAGERSLREGMTAVFGEGDAVQLKNPPDAEKPWEVLLVSGQPIGEPVARSGPFVMNSAEEIEKAYEDFRSGRLAGR